MLNETQTGFRPHLIYNPLFDPLIRVFQRKSESNSIGALTEELLLQNPNQALSQAAIRFRVSIVLQLLFFTYIASSLLICQPSSNESAYWTAEHYLQLYMALEFICLVQNSYSLRVLKSEQLKPKITRVSPYVLDIALTAFQCFGCFLVFFYNQETSSYTFNQINMTAIVLLAFPKVSVCLIVLTITMLLSPCLIAMAADRLRNPQPDPFSFFDGNSSFDGLFEHNGRKISEDIIIDLKLNSMSYNSNYFDAKDCPICINEFYSGDSIVILPCH